MVQLGQDPQSPSSSITVVGVWVEERTLPIHMRGLVVYTKDHEGDMGSKMIAKVAMEKEDFGF